MSGSYVADYREHKRREAKANGTKCNYTGQDVKFMVWMNTIEKLVVQKIDVCLTDLPDEDYMMMFTEGVTPGVMAHVVIDNFRGFMDALR